MEAQGRLRLFDTIRGFSIVSMVAFHLCYDLKFIAGHELAWFEPPLRDIWRASISWTFLFVAGCMCALSRHNGRRALRYGAFALAIYLVTSIAAVDTPISFGIIYCMAACTFVEWLLEQLRLSPKGPVAAVALFVCFVLLLPLARGRIGIGPFMIAVPSAPYDSGLFSWLGMPGPGFASGDYYPLLPYLMIYLAGSAMGWWWKERGFPSVAYQVGCPPLEAIGRHPLIVYAVHQPLLLALVSVLPAA